MTSGLGSCFPVLPDNNGVTKLEMISLRGHDAMEKSCEVDTGPARHSTMERLHESCTLPCHTTLTQ